MKIKIEFDCDNAAFVDNLEGEVESVLSYVKALVHHDVTKGPIRDSNGNTVGYYHKSP